MFEEMFEEREREMFLHINDSSDSSDLENSKYHGIISQEDFEQKIKKILMFNELATNLIKANYNNEAEKQLIEIKKQYKKLKKYVIEDSENINLLAKLEFEVLGNLSILSCKKGYYEKGGEYYHELVVSTQENEAFFREKSHLFLRPIIEVQKANKIYDQALKNLFVLADRSSGVELINVYKEISDVYVNLGDKSLAKVEKENYYNKAIYYQDAAKDESFKKCTLKFVSELSLNKALIYIKLNDVRKAKSCFKTSLSFNSKNQKAKESYANFLTDRLEKLEITKPELTTKRELKKYNSAYKSIQYEMKKCGLAL